MGNTHYFTTNLKKIISVFASFFFFKEICINNIDIKKPFIRFFFFIIIFFLDKIYIRIIDIQCLSYNIFYCICNIIKIILITIIFLLLNRFFLIKEMNEWELNIYIH